MTSPSPNMLTTREMVARAKEDIAETLLGGGKLTDIPMQTVMIAIEGEQNERIQVLTDSINSVLEANRVSSRRFWQWAGLMLTAGIGLGIGLGQVLT